MINTCVVIVNISILTLLWKKYCQNVPQTINISTGRTRILTKVLTMCGRGPQNTSWSKMFKTILYIPPLVGPVFLNPSSLTILPIPSKEHQTSVQVPNINKIFPVSSLVRLGVVRIPEGTRQRIYRTWESLWRAACSSGHQNSGCAYGWHYCGHDQAR